ncbi:cytochrome bd ubiquinol oxidase subunit II [Desulfovibrio sp. X2]|uniref:cytochrome d ubiquinol oxidase subunit II n=1 Tax=Desulfovibrio sp. X2 TaxID=941449 RepID=UPI000358C1CF|nr:cytochrome d ubiquinol oxidase subunit II [Desulfovibrio sp. X2]EPR43553.1 cytochrome bd ubiquinol oxidase subunit II [Desulfovibrio sp. X2]
MMAVNPYADVWFLIIAAILFLYLALDGADLGVGLLLLLHGEDEGREAMIGTVSSVWHANQTWLVVLGGALFGAFPLVYSLLLPALYLPFLLLLMGLICRGVAMEYHHGAARPRGWLTALGLGSLCIVAAQALIAGALLSGLPVADGRYTGGFWDFLSLGALPVAALLLMADLMLGGAYLMRRVQGAPRRLAAKALGFGAAGTLLAGAWLAAWAVGGGRLDPSGAVAWYPVLGLAALVCLAMLAFSARRGGPVFPWAAGLMGSLLAALAATMYPFIVPGSVRIADAASPAGVLGIMTWMFAVLLPVMVCYNGYQYYVFRPRLGGND